MMNKVSFFLTILFIFIAFSSRAQIEGKGLICKCKTLTTNPKCGKPFAAINQFVNPLSTMGVFFKNGKASLYYITETKSRNKVIAKVAKDINSFEYTVNPNQIYWPSIEHATNKKLWYKNYAGDSIFTIDRGIFEIDRKKLIFRKTNLEASNYENEMIYDCNNSKTIKNPYKDFKSFFSQMKNISAVENKKLKDLEKGNKF